MLNTLRTELERNRFVGDIRGKGLFIAVEFVKDKETKKPAPEIAKKVRERCYKRGLITELGGHYSNVVRFLPPLILSDELAEKGIEIFIESVRKVEAGT